MKNHTNDCDILTTGVCTCMVTSSHPHQMPATGPRGNPNLSRDEADYFHRFGHIPNPMQLGAFQRMRAERGQGKAGTSRYVDTEPRVTWLGGERYVHPPNCAVYKAPELNWAPYCDCFIRQLDQSGDPTDAAPRDRVPSSAPVLAPRLKPGWVQSRAPWWVWGIIGFGAGSISAFASVGRLPW